MATHFSILAWEIQGQRSLAGLQSMGLQRITYNLATINNHLFISTNALLIGQSPGYWVSLVWKEENGMFLSHWIFIPVNNGCFKLNQCQDSKILVYGNCSESSLLVCLSGKEIMRMAFGREPSISWASQVAQRQRTRLPMQQLQELQVRSPGREAPLEEEMAAHSSILGWEIPWAEEPSVLQSMGSQRVKYAWGTCSHACVPVSTHTCTHQSQWQQ